MQNLEASMNKKDILELKKRYKKNDCTFTKLGGCYVNAEREIILKFEETFLNLEDDEFYKYLEIAKKTLSGTNGNNLLELEFPLKEEEAGGKQQFLLGLRESKLKNSELLDTFYQLVIDNYDYAGNYLILIYHDSYDVMTKTSDNRKLDESEEVYEYLLCAICPVSLSKPGLGYLEIENRIGSRNRDWVVEAPDSGFLFPAFTERSSDIHSIMFYTKDAKEPHVELIEEGLGCPSRPTGTQQKNTFHAIISNSIEDEEKRTKAIMEIQDSLSQIIEEYEETENDDSEPVVLKNDSMKEILNETGLPEEITKKIETAYEENFKDTPPVVEFLIDNKLLAEHEKRKREMELFEQVQMLQEQLEVSKSSQLEEDYDIVLKVKPEKVNQISRDYINGKKCIIIPVEEDEQTYVNGMTDII